MLVFGTCQCSFACMRTLAPMATARTRSKTARKRPPEQGRKHAAFARSRAHILASSVELMAQVGPSATVEQVAAHAGVATSTLYQHFTDREALFTAALVFAQNDWEQWMIAAVAPVPGDLEKLSVSTRLFLRAGQTHPNYGRMTAYSLGPIAEQLPLFTKSIRDHIQALAAKHLIATDRLEERTDAFTACLFGALITQFRKENPKRADTDVELALGLLGIPPSHAKLLAHTKLPPLTKPKA